MNLLSLKQKLSEFLKTNELGPACVIAFGSLVLLVFFFGLSNCMNRSRVEKEILKDIRTLQNLDEDLDYSFLNAEMLYTDELHIMDSFRQAR